MQLRSHAVDLAHVGEALGQYRDYDFVCAAEPV